MKKILKRKKEVRIREHEYIPEFRKRKMKWENTVYLGIELELEGGFEGFSNSCEKYLKNSIDKILNPRTDVFYYKNEYCLGGGVEIVSHPVTLQYIHNRMKLFEFFKKIKEDESLFPTQGCGLHVHLSKNFFTKLEQTKLRLFFSTNSIKLRKFSMRKEDEIKEWCPFERYSVKDFLRKRKGYQSGEYHSCTMERNIAQTIEIRLFASTDNHKRFISVLQFCDAVSYFVKEISIISISKKDCWNNFISWCEQTNRYCHFLEDCYKLGLA